MDPYAAACGHVFCLACIDEWFAFTAQQQRICKCPNCNLVIRKCVLRKIYIPQSEALVEELSALRIQVKDLEVCNASLKSEVEGLRNEVEGYQSLTEELLADMYNDDDSEPQKRNLVASAWHGILTTTKNVISRETALRGVASMLYDFLTSAGSVLLWFGVEFVWRVATRPEECLREAAMYVWVFTDIVASAMIVVVALVGILCGHYECMAIWVDYGYPRLCGLIQCMRRKSSPVLGPSDP